MFLRFRENLFREDLYVFAKERIYELKKKINFLQIKRDKGAS